MEVENSEAAIQSEGSAPTGDFSVKSFGFNRGKHVSFRDLVLGDRRRVGSSVQSKFVAEEMGKISLVGGDRLRLAISFSEEAKRKLSVPWEDALIISMLGLKVGFMALKDRLSRLWGVQGRFELLDLGFGFFLVKFDRAEDRSGVLDGGPWMVFDHYLAVSPWSRDFSPATCQIRKTVVWVRLPALGLLYYEEEALKLIASAIGKPIKVDYNTLTVNRGKYARVCVEIDLSLPVISSVLIDGEWQRVEYEGLHLICTRCGKYGHFQRDCSEVEKEKCAESVNGVAEGEEQSPFVEKRDTDSVVEDDVAYSNDLENVPPQPPIGEWVTVRSRRKKKETTTKKEEIANLQKHKNGTVEKQHSWSEGNTAMVFQATKKASRTGGRGYHAEQGSAARGCPVATAVSAKSTKEMDRQGLKRTRTTHELGNDSFSRAEKDLSGDYNFSLPADPSDSVMPRSESSLLTTAVNSVWS